MIHMVIVHVAVGAVPGSANTAGDGCSIKANFISQSLQTCMNFFARVQSHKQVVTATRPLHGSGSRWWVMRLPFTRPLC